jgi:putative endonuclease
MMVMITKFLIKALDAVTAGRTSAGRDSEHLVTGQRGEDAAYFYLRQTGYTIVARNWRSRRRKGEIDLVGWEGETLCFIEVKTRSTRDVKPAEAAVDRNKQRELRAMAREYVWRSSRSSIIASGEHHGSSCVVRRETDCRFDVVSVYYDAHYHGVTDITLYRNSFPLS